MLSFLAAALPTLRRPTATAPIANAPMAAAPPASAPVASARNATPPAAMPPTAMPLTLTAGKSADCAFCATHDVLPAHNECPSSASACLWLILQAARAASKWRESRTAGSCALATYVPEAGKSV
jgi:hypothetical protein